MFELLKRDDDVAPPVAVVIVVVVLGSSSAELIGGLAIGFLRPVAVVDDADGEQSADLVPFSPPLWIILNLETVDLETITEASEQRLSDSSGAKCG